MNLIITTLLNRRKIYYDYLFVYIKSLIDSGYTDDILIITYGKIEDNISEYFKKNKILIHPIDYKESDIINNKRVYDIYKLLPILDYDKILITDIDISFQGSIYPLFNMMNDKFIYTSDEPAMYKKGIQYLNMFHNSDDEKAALYKFNEIIKENKSIINCGVLGGRKDVLINKLNNYFDYSKTIVEKYGKDTIVFNMIYNKEKDLIIKDKYNYLTKRGLNLIDGIYYTDDNNEIVVLHDAGSDAKHRKNNLINKI